MDGGNRWRGEEKRREEKAKREREVALVRPSLAVLFIPLV
jgi:hypothetical protein